MARTFHLLVAVLLAVLLVGARANPLSLAGISDETGALLVDGVNTVSSSSGNQPVGMIINEDGSGHSTLAYSSTPVHPNLFVEWRGCLPIKWSSGTFKITGNSISGSGAKGFHRFFSVKRFGGPGKSVVIKARGRYTAIYSDAGWGGWRGTKLGMKWPSLTDQSGYPKDHPRSVAGGQGYGQSSMIFSVGIHEKGKTELARYYSGSYLNFKYGDTVAYTTGQWRDETIQVDWISGTKIIRIRFWRNALGTGTPNFDYTWVNAPEQFHQPGFLWNRGDFVDFEYDWLTVEEITEGQAVISCPSVANAKEEQITTTYTVESSSVGTGLWHWNYTGIWGASATDHYTNDIGNKAALRFSGVAVTLYGVKEPNGGIMPVRIDGVEVSQANLYSATRIEDTVTFVVDGLTDAEHTIEIECTGNHDINAGGHYINIDRAVVGITGDAPTETAPTAPGAGAARPAVHLLPYRGSWESGKVDGTWSIWNTPIGSGAKLVSSGLQPANASGGGKITSDPIHISYPTDPIKTLTTDDPRVSGFSAQVRVSAGDTAPGDYSKGNSITALLLSTDATRFWQGHPLRLTDGGNPHITGYLDPHAAPDDLYGQGHYGAHGGAHMSGLACVRKWEWDATNEDAIRHAIPINLYANRFLSTSTNGKRWPANSADSYYLNNYKGSNTAMKMGSLLTLPAEYTWDAALPLNTRKILYALKHFGFYVVDDSAWDVHQMSVEKTVTSEWSAMPLSTFHSPIMNALTASMVVDNNSPTSVGGGGVPRAPLVPDVVR